MRVLSGWYAHYRSAEQRQIAIEKLIAAEEQEYYRLDAKWNTFARQLPQRLNQIQSEHFPAYDMNLIAQNRCWAAWKRLRAIGVEVPKPTDGREVGSAMTPDEQDDLKKAKQE